MRAEAPTGFDTIDWTRAWLEGVAPAGQAIRAAGADWRERLNAAAASIDLRNHRGLPLRFVPQEALPANTAYEAYISHTGCVPTRENLHDFFNALVWLTWPRTKVQLNRLQAEELQRRAAQASTDAGRGSLRDGATIFDENAAVFLCSDSAIIDALREHRWQELFITHAPGFGQHWQVRLFGHALMEKLVMPYKAITAHAWIVQTPGDYFRWPEDDRQSWADEQVCLQIAGGLVTADFAPLPVLGIPGWQAGQDVAFYADQAVFRAKRRSRT